jgi:hypothetical protein
MLGLAVIANLSSGKVWGQIEHIKTLGNASSQHWKELESPHISIVFPRPYRSTATKLARRAEHIYEEYQARMGTSPVKITLYYFGHDKLLSKPRASTIIDANNIWSPKSSKKRVLHLTGLNDRLRYEIATACQNYIQSIYAEYLHFIAYPPPDFPWQDGLVAFLVHPQKTLRQQRILQKKMRTKKQTSNISRLQANRLNILVGRSQIQYFTNLNADNSLKNIYTQRQPFLLGLFHYFDFSPAFKKGTGISYPAFVQKWRSHEEQGMKTNKSANMRGSSSKPKLHSVYPESHSFDHNSVPDSLKPRIKPYHPFLHTDLKTPVVLPYYASPDNYGLGAYLKFAEPLGTHSINITGLFSAAHPIHKSYFTTKYINNSFRPRLSLHFNHFTSGSLIIGRFRKVRFSNILAASSLWKLSGTSHQTGNWYLGLGMRYMTFGYFPEKMLLNKYPHLFLKNEKTHQTDLKTVLTWKSFTRGRNTFINPGAGSGVQLAVTGSDKILGSDVQYARFNLSGYTIFPAFNKQRLYLYADGVVDIGAPAGRDYLAFSKGGKYELPGPSFMGEVNPAHKQFVRGYNTPLLGGRFLFGRLEYRIPFEFNTTRKLFGVIPPARTVFTFFSDAGVMGQARIAPNITHTRFRWSAGFEIKRVFSLPGNIRLAYELGLGQPFTTSFGPRPYIRVQTAIPF